MRARRPAWPLPAALALHLAIAAALATAPPRHLPPAKEATAVALVAMPTPAPEPPDTAFTGAADLPETPPNAVLWPGPPAEPLPDPAPPVKAARAPTPPRTTVPQRRTAGPVPEGPAQAAAPPAASSSEIAAWQAALSAWVERHRRYPPAARFRQEEGVVRVRFELDSAGTVRHVALETPSGSAALDAAALALLAGATLPAPPAGMDPARRTVSLPIRYRLE